VTDPNLPEADRARLFAAAERWLAEDPDADTTIELDLLLDRAQAGEPGALAELASAFAGPLTFGTAGLRGALGPGPARMNRTVVVHASAGLARYLLDRGHAGRTVLVGHDARHHSSIFARDTAEILAGAGLRAVLVEGPIPTPVIAYGIRHLDAVAAVVVTASHNPATDNGYKVYLGDGSQIVPPADALIAERITEVSRLPLSELPRSPGFDRAGADLVEAYVTRAASLLAARPDRSLRWVYTPMHGVGLPDPVVVPAQAEPDPDFPTVAYPNPEEPGALDLAVELARDCEADLVIANDPDADRCAVAVPDPVSGWRMLTGDELGALLGADALDRRVRGTYASSIVSSTLLATMAQAAGEPFVATPTGFKWIGRVPGLAYGYEEALGYCTDPAGVADKDGITALVRVLDLAGRLAAQGRTLLGMLDSLMRRHGLHQTGQLAVRTDDPGIIAGAMARLRTSAPDVLGGEPVAVTDLSRPDGDLPPIDAVLLEGPSVRVVVRPSGTEPKLKCYLQVRLTPTESQDLTAARVTAERRVARIREELTAVLGLG